MRSCLEVHLHPGLSAAASLVVACAAASCGGDEVGALGGSTSAGASTTSVLPTSSSASSGDTTDVTGGSGTGDASSTSVTGATEETGAPPFTGACGPGLYHPYKQVFWGDLHVHTSYSLDSWVFANRNDPSDAYAFARDEVALPIAEGEGGTAVAKIDQRLDFAAVTDHSEFLTLVGQCQLGADGNDDVCADLNDQGSVQQDAQLAALLARLLAEDPAPLPGCVGPLGAQQCAAAAKTAWEKTKMAAEAANSPCSFTSLVAYEWTATTGAANLHRNVIFASSSTPDVVYDYINYPTALELWQALDAGCRPEQGCDVLTIPHNSNLSKGIMWDTADDATSRQFMQRYQRLVEIHQHKGASECVVGGALADGDCDFEDADDSDPATSAPGYVRNALARGLVMGAQVGGNPLMMGIVGATDTHNGTPGYVAEQGWDGKGWQGHAANNDDTASERLDGFATYGPGAVTGVWAHENTREEIFAALQRRETYATSGPRITVRFYVLDQVTPAAAAAFCADPEFPKALVDAGARPMGSEVTGFVAPTLFVAGAAAGVPLERVDLVRIGRNDMGEPALTITPHGLDGADVMTFCWSWAESDAFDPGRPWLYYARVLQSATPRWSALDCQAAPDSAACADPAVPTTVKERAWTSPVFLSP